jgi:integrase
MDSLGNLPIMIESVLIKNRGELKASSITRYRQVLQKLHRELYGKGKDYTLNSFLDFKKILPYLNGVEIVAKKNYLNGLIALTENEIYKNELENIRGQLQARAEQTYKTEKQREGEITLDELAEKYNEYEAKAKLIYKKKKADIKMSDLQTLQDFILLALMSGVFIPPRRNLDWIDFKVKNIDINRSNFFLPIENKLVFNTYKGSDQKGKQEVIIPKKLTTILKKYIKFIDNEYLFYDSVKSKLSVSQITQRFYRILPSGKTTTNDLRHAYITERLGNQFLQGQNIMKDMGSSSGMARTYIKF